MSTNSNQTPDPNEGRAYAGYIKDIWLEVPEYHFEHEPLEEPTNEKWVGREEIEKKLAGYLEDGDSGSYLITGYRGMGKTSFVRRVVKGYAERSMFQPWGKRYRAWREEKKQKERNDNVRIATTWFAWLRSPKNKRPKKKPHKAIKEVTVSFGQRDIKELDVLRQIIKGMMDEILPHKLFKFLHRYVFTFRALPIWAGLVFLFLLASNGDPITRWDDREKKHQEHDSARKVRTAEAKLSSGDTSRMVMLVTEAADEGVGLELSWKHEDLWKLLLSPHGFEVGGALLILSLLFGFVLLALFRFLFHQTVTSLSHYEKLEDLHDRCRSKIIREDGGAGASEKLPFSFSEKQVKHFPIANPKEVENEIIRILDRYGGNSKRENRVLTTLRFLLVRAVKWRGIFFILFLASTAVLLYRLNYSTGYFEKAVGFILKNLSTHRIDRSVIGAWAALLSLVTLILSVVWIFIRDWSKFISSFYQRKFIFIFDEIDKIDPSTRPPGTAPEPDAANSLSTSILLSDVRERRRAVINILANLKYLITTARAKFIFIAGREMFDAALADVADRQSAVSSIFHQIINVDSFLKDRTADPANRRAGNLTTLVEEYLERILLQPLRRAEYDTASSPEEKMDTMLSNDERQPFLKNYRKYLEREAKRNKKDGKIQFGAASTAGRHGVANPKAINKIIFSLQSLVIYLTYRSNGSPKKLVRMLEDMMASGGKIEGYYSGEGVYENARSIWFTAPRNPRASAGDGGGKRRYLQLGYSLQYKLGFLNYVVRPFISSHGRYYKTYSDKILVSTPYLLDHIMKFHQFAFSLRNLELVPEVLSETRAPELRSFIEDLVGYLGQSHLRDAHNGLFDYKFYHRTFHEIEFLCKLYEDESAAFNFSLDETFLVKQHLRKRIRSLRETYKSFAHGKEGTPYIVSLSFLNETLGDALFFDQEYDEAIVAYADAIQTLEQHLDDAYPAEFEKLVSYMLIKIKLGLTHEKMKNFDNAYAMYVETFSRAERFLKAGRGTRGRQDFLELALQSIIASLYLLEKMDASGVAAGRVRALAGRVDDIAYRLTGLEGDAADAHVLSATFSAAVGTLLYYKNASEENENPYAVTSAAGSRFVGDSIVPAPEPGSQTGSYASTDVPGLPLAVTTSDAHQNAIQEFRGLTRYDYVVKKRQKGLELGNNIWHDFRVSASAYAYLRKNLQSLLLCKGGKTCEEGDNLITLLRSAENIISAFIGTNDVHENAEPDIIAKHDKAYLRNLASSLYKLADCLYASIRATHLDRATGKTLVGCEPAKSIKRILKEPLSDRADGIKGWSFFSFDAVGFDKVLKKAAPHDVVWAERFDNTVFQLVVCMYYWSGRLFMHIGKNHSCSLMYRKVIQTFRLLATPKVINRYRDLLRRHFLEQILLIGSWNTNAADKYQYEKAIHTVTDGKPDDNTKHQTLFATSGSAEIREALILFGEMEMKAASGDAAKLGECRNRLSALVSQYNTIPTQTIRYFELGLQIRLNEYAVSNCVGRGFSRIVANLRTIKCQDKFTQRDYQVRQHVRSRIFVRRNSLSALIANSIFALHEIINIYHGFGLNYFNSFHSAARYHERLGDWLAFYEAYKDDLPGVKGYLDSLMGNPEYLRTTSAVSHYQMALQHYSRARQLHSGGASYKAQIVNMYYLEDDFNDGLYSFGLAVERQQINSGAMRIRIDALRPVVEHHERNLYGAIILPA